MEKVSKLQDATPKPRSYYEKIGDTKWEIQETELDVEKDVELWVSNPRLLPHLPQGAIVSEVELEHALTQTPGYENLRRSILNLGQSEPIYVWRQEGAGRYLVLEGATRVTVLRDLMRKHESGHDAGKFRRVKVKILPPHFEERYQVILLARIHVRGSGVRAWGRYIESKFIHENVTERNGKMPLMTVSEMANYMEKSISWVGRLRDAYEFGRKFVDYVDDGVQGEKLGLKYFSTLEEISKAPKVGPMLRDYQNPAHDKLREEVFEMVRKGVFKEYRNARFLQDFYEDAEKWALLKTGEENIADKLAAEIKAGNNSVKAKISNLEQAIERSLQHDSNSFDEQDVEHLHNAASRINRVLHAELEPFRIELKSATKMLEKATMHDVKALTVGDLDEFKSALEYFNMLVTKYGNK